MTNPICPKTCAPMHRDVRSMPLTYKGESITFDMPGWYCDQSDESIHTGKDMRVSDRISSALVLLDHDPDALSILKKRQNKTHVLSHAALLPG